MGFVLSLLVRFYSSASFWRGEGDGGVHWRCMLLLFSDGASMFGFRRTKRPRDMWGGVFISFFFFFDGTMSNMKDWRRET